MKPPVAEQPLVADTVRQFLTDEGWREYKSIGRTIWCKRWKDAPRCRSNNGQEGIQVVVTAHEWEGRTSYEIDVTGEKPDGVWVKLSSYNISAEEICDVLNPNANQLVSAWTQLHSIAFSFTVSPKPITLYVNHQTTKGKKDTI